MLKNNEILYLLITNSRKITESCIQCFFNSTFQTEIQTLFTAKVWICSTISRNCRYATVCTSVIGSVKIRICFHLTATLCGIFKQHMGARNRVGIGLSYRPARARIFKQSMGARNRVGKGLSYRPAGLPSLAELIYWNRFLGYINVYKFGLRLHRLAELIPWNRFPGSLKIRELDCGSQDLYPEPHRYSIEVILASFFRCPFKTTEPRPPKMRRTCWEGYPGTAYPPAVSEESSHHSEKFQTSLFADSLLSDRKILSVEKYLQTFQCCAAVLDLSCNCWGVVNLNLTFPAFLIFIWSYRKFMLCIKTCR